MRKWRTDMVRDSGLRTTKEKTPRSSSHLCSEYYTASLY